ncbi:MAG TPA: RNA-directed DNA polymerase [Hanamia sp.]|nr:RNA-directed DNA polymerase [Hanamia sp.]
MKRKGNLYQDIISIENLTLAESIARKGKLNQYGVKVFDKNAEANIIALHQSLLNKTFTTSAYSIFKIHEPKEREIYRLPYCPDRIVHHGIMLKLEDLFVKSFTADTYSCIKGRGIHATSFVLRKALKDESATKYYLKIDIQKFYPSVDHDILKLLLRRKIKDTDLLWLLDNIIDSAPGIPIGNYLSQYFGNFYLNGLDHYLKEKLGVKHLFRYADDIVILSGSKEYLHNILGEIKIYLEVNLKLKLKPNYRIAPVEPNGIDFAGYVHFHKYVLIRKKIKQNLARKVAKGIAPASRASYNGILKHCNSIHLRKKLLSA